MYAKRRRVFKTGYKSYASRYRASSRAAPLRTTRRASSASKKTARAVVKSKYITEKFIVTKVMNPPMALANNGDRCFNWGESTLIDSLVDQVQRQESFARVSEYVDAGLESVKMAVFTYDAPFSHEHPASGLHAIRLGNLTNVQRQSYAAYSPDAIGCFQYSKMRKFAQNLSMRFDFKNYAKKYEMKSRIPVSDLSDPLKVRAYLGSKCPEFIYGAFLNTEGQLASVGTQVQLAVIRWTLKFSFRGRPK